MEALISFPTASEHCRKTKLTNMYSLDSMQASLRMCLDPSSTHGLREAVEYFVCLSSSMCIEYRLRHFHRYNVQRGRPGETNSQTGRCRAIFWNSWQSAWTFILSYDKMT